MNLTQPARLLVFKGGRKDRPRVGSQRDSAFIRQARALEERSPGATAIVEDLIRQIFREIKGMKRRVR